MTRAENLRIWQVIANGILRDDGVSYAQDPEFNGEQEPEVSHEQETALTFIQQVAIDILAADQSNPNERAERIMKAVGLAGRLDPDEHAKRKATGLVEDFFSHLPEKERQLILLGLLRDELGVPGVRDEKTDVERLRQIKAFLKKGADRK
jgi:hypothetical protein